MVDTGDSAPDFTAPLANGDIESLTLSDELGDAPIVLAFFPGAFTGVCTDEMCTFQDRLSGFEDIGATVYGISRDTPFSLNEFRDQNDLSFGLISDLNKEIIDAYDIEMDFDDLGVYGVAKRSVFVVDADGEITYSWVSDDPGVEPDYEEVREAAAAAATVEAAD
ncbi:Peroxiredoxin [Natronoarchaeum philippinense]|uniref:Peroxiredoxin n=1 Tax=Natronoarchaeum philippinense TaxID=558529 RepID=A0A285NWU2_NATPI|nr:redoxin domain-containing protein [Natronoarchaeum philippinense]SNZ13507.1 Peroxiredoxin [Natronoarchaeum philippinense]